MSKNQVHIKLYFYLAILIAFSLPFARLTPVFIVVMVVNWLVEGDFKNKFSSFLKNKYSLLFCSFYLLHAVGLLYSQNIDSAGFDLQVKLSLLIFPIQLSSRPFNTKAKDSIFYALISGVVLSSFIILIRASYVYFTIGENDFYYEVFSYFIHPSYFSMYINVCIGWILINLLQNNRTVLVVNNLIILLLVLFLSVIVLLLSSKMGIITMVLMYVFFIISYIITHKKYLIGILGLLLLAISSVMVIKLVPEIQGRIDRAFSAVVNPTPKSTDAESTAVRLLIWNAANQVISENLWVGVGTGDAKDALMKEYTKRGMTGAIEHDLNAHNEFYQVFVALGIIGFVLLLSNLYFPLIFAFKNGNLVYLLFLIIIILNFLPESMLETQAGVMFFAFFNSLLCFHKSKSKD